MADMLNRWYSAVFQTACSVVKYAFKQKTNLRLPVNPCPHLSDLQLSEVSGLTQGIIQGSIWQHCHYALSILACVIYLNKP